MSPLAVELEPALCVITCLIMNASLTSGGDATRWRLPHAQPDKAASRRHWQARIHYQYPPSTRERGEGGWGGVPVCLGGLSQLGLSQFVFFRAVIENILLPRAADWWDSSVRVPSILAVIWQTFHW